MLDSVQAKEGYEIIRFDNHHGHYASWVFKSAVGEMRGVVQLAQLAATYGLDIEDDLASILPAADTDGKP